MSIAGDPMGEIGSHDSIFSRGWEVGFVQARIAERAGFERWFLASHLDTILRLLRAGGADFYVGRRIVGRYGVCWVPLIVAFPRPADRPTPRRGGRLAAIRFRGSRRGLPT